MTRVTEDARDRAYSHTLTELKDKSAESFVRMWEKADDISKRYAIL
ncbi:MAG TPA: hypothetical protein VFA20_08975 [Myxococcaceae bacterium]|nr:hypothetical protein [Myxococcaceae bacterium]